MTEPLRFLAHRASRAAEALESLRARCGEQQANVAARVAYKLRHTFNERTKLIHGVEAFPSTEDSDDVYFQATTEVRTNLTDSMIGSIAWIWDYDNTPAPTRERSDHRVLLTVGWSF